MSDNHLDEVMIEDQSEQTKLTEDTYDVVIVGAGPAGLLLSSQLAHFGKKQSILIVDQSPAAGGRIKISAPELNSWGLGFHWMSAKLINAFNEILLLDPESPTIDFCKPQKITDVGFLSGSSLSRVGWADLFGEKGFRTIGGLAAKRAWPKFEKACNDLKDESRKNQTFQTLWTDTRKSPAALVLSQLASFLGIPDIWHCRADLIVDLALASENPLTGDWELLFKSILQNLTKNENIELRFNSQVFDCKRQSDVEVPWRLETARGVVQARKVVVAQPPWSALDWISKSYWPKELLQLAIKAKPVSNISICDKVDPEVLKSKLNELSAIMVMSEDALFVPHASGEMVFRASIDYENTLQAPEVVKTIKALRRARRKVFKFLEFSEEEIKNCTEHVCLTSVGWSHSTQLGDERLFDRLEGNLETPDGLYFVGDAYGSSNFPDENIIQSVKEIFNALTSDPIEGGKRRKRQGASVKDLELDEQENLNDVEKDSDLEAKAENTTRDDVSSDY